MVINEINPKIKPAKIIGISFLVFHKRRRKISKIIGAKKIAEIFDDKANPKKIEAKIKYRFCFL